MRVVINNQPPTGLSRLLFRMPIAIYRLRLGWLFGHRLLLRCGIADWRRTFYPG
jgi:hypothetical protein